MKRAGEERYALYRFYDDRENLLYAGISNDPWRRRREHVLTQAWYPKVKHQAITWYDTEGEARAAETRAIRNERPRFNVAGAVRQPEARFSLKPDTAIKVCFIWLCVAAAAIPAFVFLSAHVPAHWMRPLAPETAGVALSAFIPFSARLLVVRAPQVYRFGCWLDRNFGEEAQRRAVAGDAPSPLRRGGLLGRASFMRDGRAPVAPASTGRA